MDKLNKIVEMFDIATETDEGELLLFPTTPELAVLLTGVLLSECLDYEVQFVDDNDITIIVFTEA